jgi:colicin import membrane protein
MVRSGFGLTPRSIALSLAVHAVLAALLFVSLDWTPTRKPMAGRPQPEPIKAAMVSEAEIERQLQEIRASEEKKRLEEEKAKQRLADLQRQAKEAERKREAEQKRVAELERKKKAEQEQAKQLALKRKTEEDRLAKLKKEEQAKQDREAEEKRQAELARKKKLEAEKKRQAELARKKKLEAERKRKAEVERERKLAEQERERREAALQAQLEAERVARLVDAARGQYVPIIRQKVSRNWNQPPNTRSGIAARVQVRLSAGGEVINARIVKSSGDPIFDRSVENAVYKASPLPIPQERGINEQFRSLTLTFKPEDLIS